MLVAMLVGYTLLILLTSYVYISLLLYPFASVCYHLLEYCCIVVVCYLHIIVSP